MTGGAGEYMGRVRALPDGPGPRTAAGIGDCPDNVCITCSDTAVEVIVQRLLGDGMAVVDTGTGQEEISVALVTARPGDRVLVHAREAIAVISPPPEDGK